MYTSEQVCMYLPCISEGDAPLPHMEAFRGRLFCMVMASRVGAGAVWSVLPPRAMQASPPLRDWLRLKTLHTGIHKKSIPESHVEVSTMAMQRYDGRLVLLGYRASVLFDLQSLALLEVQAYASDEGGADKHSD